MAVVLVGTVVTFDPARPSLDPGAVYVGDDGRLAGVLAADDTPPSGFASARRDPVAPKLTAGQVMIYHVAEGIPGSTVHQEFTDLDTGGCLQPGLLGVHATALTAADFKHWQQQVRAIDSDQRATVVWSPFS